MNKSSLVSVIVPVYKVEDYLNRCIDSIINQSYCNLEILLVDDGSPDSCGNICDEYAEKDTRIIVIHKENGGLSDARNAACDVCNGDYITFVDSDDCLKNTYVENLLEVCIKEDVDICIGHLIKGEKRITTIFSQEKEYKVYLKEDFLDGWHGCYTDIETTAWGKLYKREVFFQSDGTAIRYPVGHLHEDVLTTHLLVYNSTRIAVLNCADYIYTYNPQSITNAAYTIKKFIDFNYAQEMRMEFFREHNIETAYYRLFLFTAKGWMLNCSQAICNNLHYCDEYQIVRKKFFSTYKSLQKTPGIKVFERFLFFLFKLFPRFCAYVLFPLYQIGHNNYSRRNYFIHGTDT